MEKRVLLAVVLSFVVLYGYQVIFPPPAPVNVPPANAPAVQGATAPGPATPAAAAAEAPPAEPQGDAVVGEQAERDIVVENEAVRAIFTNRGAVLKSWLLKHYKGTDNAPLDIVPQAVKGAVRPFALAVEDAKISAAVNNAFYKASADALTVGAGPSTLTFDYTGSTGVAVRKEFTFDPAHPYVVGFKASVTHEGKAVGATMQFGPALGTGIVETSMGTYSQGAQPIFYRDGSVTRVGTSSIQERPIEEGTFGFVGVDDHYFLTAALPGGQPQRVEYQPVSVPIAGSDQAANFVSWAMRSNEASISPARYFLGPKDFDVLASVDRDLVRSIHFGMFSVIVVPLLRALKWINGYVGNYGWSIITLTVLINLAMFPLRHKSVVSMRKMQNLQPEVKAIQERYAKLKMSDPGKQKMNVELMNLYRERGVNPASGCVPMLLTFPVLFAFYSMLSVAIELRGAPFVGWIHDLSAHDPLYVTPVLMGVTMFVQQWMTPSTADPVQQKMMMFMPLVFMSMFVWAPSGLVLYWTVSNIWAIGQQALTNKLMGAPVRPAIGAPAQRRMKNAGGGRTEQAAKERK
jgi:YidC/Oxa1 family membrane protein insertase